MLLFYAARGAALVGLLLPLGCVNSAGPMDAEGEASPRAESPSGTPATSDATSSDKGTTANSPATTAASTDGPRAELPLDGREGRNLALGRFRPESKLKVTQRLIRRAKFPVVDVHVHPRIRRFEYRLEEMIRLMDQQNVAVAVSLDGGLGDRFVAHRDRLWEKYRDRFVIYANIDWRGKGAEDDPASWDCHRDDFVARTVRRLREAHENGASGLKLFKNFGLQYRNPDGSLIAIDDPRWDPIWQTCGELGLVVIMHTADPAAFFEPIDEKNERWEELSRHPEWSFHGPQWPRREDLLAARNRVIARHPKTTFIGAHMANNAEDLATVGQWLDAYPNLYVEIAARIAELGRQPYTARDFFIKYAERIFFGSDGPRAPERMWLHYRFLETRDEYFPYAENAFPPQGFWRIYGLHLPDDVLRKVYYENAARIIPGVAPRVERYRTRDAEGS